MTANPDIDPTPEARIAMLLWNKEYAEGRLGSMGFWASLTKSQQSICRNALTDVARAAIRHNRTLEQMAMNP